MAREIKITIEGNQQEEIVLSNSEGKQVVIKDNSTNAKTLFELFDFEPGSKYEIDVQDAGKVKQKVFDEFVSLLSRNQKRLPKAIKAVRKSAINIDHSEKATTLRLHRL